MQRSENKFLLVTGFALACLAAPQVALAGSATVDGIVDGADSYDETYSFTGETEDNVAFSGGSLYIARDTSDGGLTGTFYAAVMLPLTLVDNTWGTNKASDWGSIDRTLEKATGSEKWEFKIEDFAGQDDDLEFKVNYGDPSDSYKGFVDKLKVKNVGDIAGTAATSIGYDYGVSTTPFTTANSPAMGPDVGGEPSYDFSGSVPGWRPEHVYEISIDLASFHTATGVVLTSALFRSWSNEWVFHASPNKLGKNVVTIDPPTPGTPPAVPLPPAAWMGLAMLAGGSLYRRARLKRQTENL